MCLQRGDCWILSPEAPCARNGDVPEIVIPCGQATGADGERHVLDDGLGLGAQTGVVGVGLQDRVDLHRRDGLRHGLRPGVAPWIGAKRRGSPNRMGNGRGKTFCRSQGGTPLTPPPVVRLCKQVV